MHRYSAHMEKNSSTYHACLKIYLFCVSDTDLQAFNSFFLIIGLWDILDHFLKLSRVSLSFEKRLTSFFVTSDWKHEYLGAERHREELLALLLVDSPPSGLISLVLNFLFKTLFGILRDASLWNVILNASIDVLLTMIFYHNDFKATSRAVNDQWKSVFRLQCSERSRSSQITLFPC